MFLQQDFILENKALFHLMAEHRWGPFSEVQSDPAVTLLLKTCSSPGWSLPSPCLLGSVGCLASRRRLCCHQRGLPGPGCMAVLTGPGASDPQHPSLAPAPAAARACPHPWSLHPSPRGGPPRVRPRSPLSSSCCSPHQEVRREQCPSVHVMPFLPLHTVLLEKSLCCHRVVKDRAWKGGSAWPCPLLESPVVPTSAAADLQS